MKKSNRFKLERLATGTYRLTDPKKNKTAYFCSDTWDVLHGIELGCQTETEIILTMEKVKNA